MLKFYHKSSTRTIKSKLSGPLNIGYGYLDWKALPFVFWNSGGEESGSWVEVNASVSVNALCLIFSFYQSWEISFQCSLSYYAEIKLLKYWAWILIV